MEEIKVLTVISYGDNPGESYRITFQPMNIAMVKSPEALVQKQGMSLHKAVVTFIEEGGATVYINGDDLKTLEEAVGFYGIEELSFSS